ncbi:MAG: hypothetical protein Q9222_000426 [Ikaeria aurantiellina]
MARTTRAAPRTQVLQEDSRVAAAVPLPATPPVTRRTPLGEISGNQEDLPVVVDDPEEILKGNKKKGSGKGKKGKISKKTKKHDPEVKEDESQHVLPDENESETSSAVEDACQDLRDGRPQGDLIIPNSEEKLSSTDVFA